MWGKVWETTQKVWEQSGEMVAPKSVEKTMYGICFLPVRLFPF
jgi:hypothetical protein